MKTTFYFSNPEQRRDLQERIKFKKGQVIIAWNVSTTARACVTNHTGKGGNSTKLCSLDCHLFVHRTLAPSVYTRSSPAQTTWPKQSSRGFDAVLHHVRLKHQFTAEGSSSHLIPGSPGLHRSSVQPGSSRMSRQRLVRRCGPWSPPSRLLPHPSLLLSNRQPRFGGM